MLDRQSPVPIYVQIEDYLKQRILQGEYAAHTAIPSERNLSDLFGVSRMTVRQSITNLVNEGLLYREKGRGTFVTSTKVEQALGGLTSFTEDMISRGMVPSNKIVHFGKGIPKADIIRSLQLEKEEEVFVAKRIRYADGEPMAIERIYIPVKLLPDLNQEILNQSLYQFVEKDKGLKIAYASQFMEAALVNEEDAKLLQIEVPSPVIVIERKSYLDNECPFEIVQSIYRADRYKFISEIRR